jgi:hypothetical protein
MSAAEITEPTGCTVDTCLGLWTAGASHRVKAGALLLSTFPQPRSSTAPQGLTCQFSESIHNLMHRTLAWAPRGWRDRSVLSCWPWGPIQRSIRLPSLPSNCTTVAVGTTTSAITSPFKQPIRPARTARHLAEHLEALRQQRQRRGRPLISRTTSTPTRLPASRRWSRKHARTQRRLCEAKASVKPMFGSNRRGRRGDAVPRCSGRRPPRRGGWGGCRPR